MNIWWTLLFWVPLHAMESAKKEVKAEPWQEVKGLIANNILSQENGYHDSFSNDLTEWQICEEKPIKKIKSKYPIIVSAINHGYYSYSDNKEVVCGDLNSKEAVTLNISNVDFILWSPEKKRLLMRSVLDGIDYFVYDVTENRWWDLTVQKGLFERIVGYVVCTLGLPGVNYMSNVHWKNRDTLIDTQRKVSWSLKEDIS